MSFKYIERIYELLKTIETEECENIKKAIDMLYECVKNNLPFTLLAQVMPVF